MRYVDNGKGVWVPAYTVGSGLGTRIARGLWKLGIKQTPGCGCSKRQRFLDGGRRPVRTMPAISGGSNPDNVEDICVSDSNVFFCENWENRPAGPVATGSGGTLPAQTLNTGWFMFPDASAGTIITSDSFTGTRSLRMTTPGNNTNCCTSGGTAETRDTIGSNVTEFYWRWYQKFDAAYFWSPVATKGTEYAFSGSTDNASASTGVFNSTTDSGLTTPKHVTLGHEETGNNIFSNWYWNQNGSPQSWQTNRWYCLEYHMRFNSNPTATDGVLEAWIDGVQHWSYSGLMFNNHPGPLKLSELFLVTYWNCDRNEVCGGPFASDPGDPKDYRHGNLHKYYDNIVVSRARIGCLGQQVGDTTPPSIVITSPTALPTYYTNSAILL